MILPKMPQSQRDAIKTVYNDILERKQRALDNRNDMMQTATVNELEGFKLGLALASCERVANIEIFLRELQNDKKI